MSDHLTFDSPPPCAQTDPELFFPDDGQVQAALQDTKAICGDCPFRSPCLTYALEHDVQGIWAGTSRHQRNMMCQQRGVTVHALHTGPRDALRDRIKALHDGTRTHQDIAFAAGCSEQTVYRHLKGSKAAS